MATSTNHSGGAAQEDGTVWVALRIWGRELDPGIVRSYFGIEPSESFARGDVKRRRSGKESPPREMGASFWKREVLESADSEIAQLLADLGNKSAFDVPGVEICILDLYFGLTDSNSVLPGSFEYRLSSEVVEGIAALGAQLRITVA